MSAKLGIEDAAGYIVDLKTSTARNECVRYWAKKHGLGYAQQVLAVILKRYPKRDFGLIVL